MHISCEKLALPSRQIHDILAFIKIFMDSIIHNKSRRFQKPQKCVQWIQSWYAALCVISNKQH